jgi:hypothetical protein
MRVKFSLILKSPLKSKSINTFDWTTWSIIYIEKSSVDGLKLPLFLAKNEASLKKK